MSNSDIIQSVERTFKVIKILINAHDGISLTNISKQVKIHKATTFRILKTLRKMDLVTQEKESRKYYLGNGFLEISLKFLGNLDLRRISLPYMQKLQEKVVETINLAIIDFDEVIYIERIESKESLRHSISIGSRAPAYCTALGKSILAFSDREIVKKVLNSKPLVKRTPYTKTKIDELLKELEAISISKIAIDDREHQEHIRCIGSPIFNASNEVIGAISISGPAARMDTEYIEKNKGEVLITSEDISIELGWKKN